MTAVQGLRRAWDRVTIYLPIILMGVLALATYLLARNTPGASPAPGVAPVRHESDYFLKDFSVKSFERNGRLRNEIQGKEAHHFPDTDTLEIEQPRLRSYDQKGAVTVATAKRAISNGDGSQVQLFGDAVVTRTPATKDVPPLELRGEFLHFFANDEKVRSDRPVTLKRGDDVFNADSLDYDNLERVLEMRGRVRGVIQPHKADGAPAKP